MIVYVDVLIVLNFIVNYLLLIVSLRLCGAGAPRLRVVLAALLGAFSSLVIFLPPFLTGIRILFKGALTLLLSAVSGGYHDIRSFVKRTGMLLLCSFFFSGLMLFVLLLSGSRIGFYQNGVCYFHISAFTLLACSVAAYLLLLLYQKWFKKELLPQTRYRVYLQTEEGELEIEGVVDSQNLLTDLFTGTPVAVGSKKALWRILPGEIRRYFSGPLEQMPAGRGLRLIPCDTAAGRDVLPAFRPRRMTLRSREGSWEIQDVYIAVAEALDGTVTDQLLLNPALIGREMQQFCEGGAGRNVGD